MKKKLLVVFLAVAMVFAMATSAMAASFSDITDLSADKQDDIKKIAALGVVNGYTDGTFRPADNITRAEFAKMVAVMGGHANSGDLLAGTSTAFKDVAANMWYTGWINLAVSQGYMKGYTDGTFKPDANITYAEVLTVVLRAIGYNDNLTGSWPVDYITKAAQLELTDGVAVSANAVAGRGSVATIISNALNEKVVYWDKEKDLFLDKGNTLLDASFKSAVLKDVQLGTWKVKTLTNKDAQLYIDAVDNANDGFKLLGDDCAISGSYNFTQLKGHYGDVILETKSNGDKFIKYIDVKSKAITTADLTFENVKDMVVKDNTGAATSNSIQYAGKVKINGVYYTVDAKNPTVVASAPAATPQLKSAYAKFFINEDGYIYGFSNLSASTTPNDPKIVKSATADRLEYADGSSYSLKGKDVLFMKSGKFITVADLKPLDVVTVNTAATDYNSELDALITVTALKTATLNSSTVNNGSIEKVKLNNVSYDASTMSINKKAGLTGNYEGVTPGLLKSVYGTEVKYVLNNKGQVTYTIANADSNISTVYGIVTGMNVDSITDKATAVTILKQDGVTATYKLDNSDGTLLYLENNLALVGGKQVTAGCAVSLTVDDKGVATDAVAYSQGLAKISYAVDTANSRINTGNGWFKVNADTVFLNAVYTTDSSGKTEFDKAEVLKAADVMSNDNLNAEGFTIVDSNGAVLNVVFVRDANGTSSGKFGVVKSLYNDGKERVSFYDGAVYVNDASSKANFATKQLFTYTVSGNKATAPTAVVTDFKVATKLIQVDAAAVAAAGNKQAKVVDADGALVSTNTGNYVTMVKKVSNSGADIVLGDELNNVNYYTNADTKVVTYDKSENSFTVEENASALVKGDKVIAITADKTEAKYANLVAYMVRLVD